MQTRPLPHPSGDAARPAPLFIEVSRPDADTLVVTASGAADLCTIPDLRRALFELTGEDRSHVVVDLDQLTFMDASLLGVLVEARLRISAIGGTLQLRCRADHGRRVLSLAGLDSMLDGRA